MARKKGPRSPDAVIAVLASRQYGVVTRRQLVHAGVSGSAVDGRIGTILHSVHAGVYAVGHPGLGIEGRWLAATLAFGPGAVLSHRAAAALWGLRPAWNRFLEVTAPRSAGGRPGIILHRSRSIEATTCRGIPVTTPARTLVDVADVAGARVLKKVLEQAEVLRLDATPVPVPGRRGHGRLVSALAELGPAVPLTRSELEDAFLELCLSAGLPAPLANLTVGGMAIDFVWPELRLAVEIDSWRYHGTRAAFGRDRRRSARMQLAGWGLLRFTDWDVACDAGYVADTCAAALARVGWIRVPQARRRGPRRR
jgi:hypothetical protein